jgi:acyl-CoA thioesterase YciA
MPDEAAKPEVTKPADAAEVLPDTEPAIRTIAMPADTNPHGDIFGGWLLCQMDLAGGNVAVRRTGGRVVTVAITAMTFHRPVCVGDEVSCYGNVEKVGHTSITIKVESWARRGTGLTPIKVTEGLFTYVRVGSDGRPQLIEAS